MGPAGGTGRERSSSGTRPHPLFGLCGPGSARLRVRGAVGRRSQAARWRTSLEARSEGESTVRHTCQLGQASRCEGDAPERERHQLTSRDCIIPSRAYASSLDQNKTDRYRCSRAARRPPQVRSATGHRVWRRAPPGPLSSTHGSLARPHNRHALCVPGRAPSFLQRAQAEEGPGGSTRRPPRVAHRQFAHINAAAACSTHTTPS